MDLLSRLSGLVTTPAKAAAGISGSPRLRHKPSLHPVGSVDVFHADWHAVQAELEAPDERALFFGIARSDLPRRLQRLVDALVFESNRSNDGHTGPCMEYLLKYDVLTQLVHLSVDDRPKGIRGETIRTLTNLIILLDERFLSRHAVNKPISQLIQLCLDEDAARFQMDDDSFETNRPTPSSSDAAAAVPEADYEEDLVDLMCHIASRIRNTPDLLHIFFADEPVDDADESIEVRSLKDGSVIVSQSMLDDPSSSGHPSPDLASAASQDWQGRPSSPTGSIDSTATIQPSTAHTTRKHAKRRLRFPLFSYLLKFVHREGRIGELARAGLLFLISLEGVNAPSKSSLQSVKGRPATKRVSFGGDDIRRSLAAFIAHSDFADVLGAGLGAAYGLLPSRMKPAPRYDPASIEPSSSQPGRASITLASSSASDADEAGASEALASATQSDDKELQMQLRLVVDLIEFCQDVLDSLWLTSRNLTEPTSADEVGEKDAVREETGVRELDPMIRKLARAIALAIRDTFIRNVVYPSLMESSDFDGSSAAVLNYLDVMVIVLRSGHILTDVALDFLLPADGAPAEAAYEINLPADHADRYSVKDLILDCLDERKRPATRVAALKLARTLVVCHGVRACSGLLQAPRHPASAAVDEWAVEAGEASEALGVGRIEMHFGEMDALAALLAPFGRGESSDWLHASLGNYLLDAERALRLDSTFALALELGTDKLRLQATDSLVQQLFGSLAQLFAQPVEVNLATTGVVVALACSPLRSLEGWLIHASDAGNETPALVELLGGLVHQVESYRTAVAGFDAYLAARRRSLVLTDDLSEALQHDASEDDSPAEGKSRVSACLTLPRVVQSGGKLQTDTAARTAEREFGIVDDRRDSLPALSPAPAANKSAGQAPVAEEAAARSAIARLFGGRPTRTPTTAAKAEPERPTAGERRISSSTINPYAEHFRQTAVVVVKTKPAVGAPMWRPPPTAGDATRSGKATLSSVLDNTIVLEEFIKELMAIVQVRRSWGIDLVAF